MTRFELVRYTVIRVHYEFVRQQASEKLFIVLRHERIANQDAVCWAIKPTSKTERFDADPELMAGCVCYEAGCLWFFPKRTIVQPDNLIPIHHSHLASEAGRRRYKIEGKMPADFHGKLIAAIRASVVLEPKKVRLLLQYIGE